MSTQDTGGIISETLPGKSLAGAQFLLADLASKRQQLHQVNEPQQTSARHHLLKRIFRRKACPIRG